jgi:hypothetical protein
MCLVSSAKKVASGVNATQNTRKPVLRNPYLDGVEPILRAQSQGVRSLRIDRAGAGTSAAPNPSPLSINRTP